jgi:hypothetical protein
MNHLEVPLAMISPPFLRRLLLLCLMAPALGLASTPAGFELGETYVGTAKSTVSGKSWMFEISFDQVAPKKAPELWGIISWPSLKSVHELDARLSNDKLTFTESEVITKGKARLGVRYEGRIEGDEHNRRVNGTYADPKGDKGTFTIELTTGGGDLRSIGVFSKRPFSGEIKSAPGGKVLAFTLTLDGNRATELFDFEGTIEWPSLGSKHLVRGTNHYGRLEFTEVEALRKGKAHLNVTYALWRDGNGLTGTYTDPAGGKGSVSIPLE